MSAPARPTTMYSPTSGKRWPSLPSRLTSTAVPHARGGRTWRGTGAAPGAAIGATAARAAIGVSSARASTACGRRLARSSRLGGSTPPRLPTAVPPLDGVRARRTVGAAGIGRLQRAACGGRTAGRTRSPIGVGVPQRGHGSALPGGSRRRHARSAQSAVPAHAAAVGAPIAWFVGHGSARASPRPASRSAPGGGPPATSAAGRRVDRRHRRHLPERPGRRHPRRRHPAGRPR